MSSNHYHLETAVSQTPSGTTYIRMPTNLIWAGRLDFCSVIRKPRRYSFTAAFSCSNSGDTYSAVPTKELQRCCEVSPIAAVPKSANLICMDSERSTFSGLISLNYMRLHSPSVDKDGLFTCEWCWVHVDTVLRWGSLRCRNGSQLRLT